MEKSEEFKLADLISSIQNIGQPDQTQKEILIKIKDNIEKCKKNCSQILEDSYSDAFSVENEETQEIK
jgi:hypothetical protein